MYAKFACAFYSYFKVGALCRLKIKTVVRKSTILRLSRLRLSMTVNFSFRHTGWCRHPVEVLQDPYVDAVCWQRECSSTTFQPNSQLEINRIWFRLAEEKDSGKKGNSWSVLTIPLAHIVRSRVRMYSGQGSGFARDRSGSSLKMYLIEYQVSAGRITSGFGLRDTSNRGLGCREVSRSSDILKYHWGLGCVPSENGLRDKPYRG